MEMQEYDAATRQNLEINCEPFLQKLLGIPFKVVGRPLDKLQANLKREVDFVRLVEVVGKEKCILHAEFQTANDSEMAYRMQEYYGILARKFKLSVWQFVFYYGKEQLRMRSRLKDRKNHFEYQLLNLANFDYKTFFESELPGVVVWSVLANPRDQLPEELLQNIKKRVIQLCKGDFYMAVKCLRELKSFSKLRNLELNNKNEIEAMKLMYDISEDELYLDGIEQGKAIGKVEGKAQGRTEGKRELVMKLLANGLLTPDQIREQLEIDPELLAQWSREQPN